MEPRHEPLTDNEPPPAATPPADQDWFGGRRWTGLGAVAVLLVIAICAAFLIWNHHGGNPQPPGAGQPASAATRPPTSGQPDQQVPTTAPVGVTWTLYQSVALPYSATAGPHHVDGDTAIGYAHTPTGALIAAAHISTRRLLALDADWRQALGAMVAPGAGRDAFAAQRAKISHSPDPAGTYAQEAGFNFLSYEPGDAVVQLVTRNSDGTLQVVPEHLVWLNDDWKLVLAADGGEATTAQQVSSLAGFVAWGGV